ncbi:MAG: hypothetical protein Q9222_002245 [Ikaeria aurantiellina]
MHSSTIISAFTAALAIFAAPALGAPTSNDLVERSAELDARAEALEARAALLVCQFGGVKACSAECVVKGHIHGGYCNSHQ